MEYIWMLIGDQVGLYLDLDLDLVRSQTYYPNHILAYGSGKTCLFRVLVSLSFRLNCMEAGIGWRSLHHIEAGPQVWELGVLVWGGECGNFDREAGRLVLLVPGVQARRVIRGTQLGYIDS